MSQPESRLIPLDALKPGPANPRDVRVRGARAQVDDLVRSVKALGVLQPLLVRPADDGFEILAGSRRFRAAKKAGLAEVPCQVLGVEDDVARAVTLAENLQRVQLHPLQEAEGIAQAIDAGQEPAELAALLGIDVQTVYRRQQLRSLHPEIKAAFLADESPIGAWGVRHLELCASYPVEVQAELAKELGEGFYFDVPRTVGDLRHWFEGQARTIAAAPWDPADETLTDAGPCVGCSSNTDTNGRLFADLGSVEGKCLDSACWQLKQRAALLRAFQAAEALHGDDLVVVVTQYSYDADQLPALGRPIHDGYANWKEVKKGAKGAVPAFVAADGREVVAGSTIWVSIPEPAESGEGAAANGSAAPQGDTPEAKLERTEELLRRKRLRHAVPALLEAAKEVEPPSRIKLLRLLSLVGGPRTVEYRSGRIDHCWSASLKSGVGEGDPAPTWSVFEAAPDDEAMILGLWRSVQEVIARRLGTKESFHDFACLEAEAQAYARLVGVSWEGLWEAAREACPPSKALVKRREAAAPSSGPLAEASDEVAA